MPNARVTSGELAWRLAPVGVALGSLALGVVALGHRSLSTDEAASAAAAQGSLGTVLSRIVHDDPGQAGELLLLKLARDVRGQRAGAAAAVRDRRRARGRAARRPRDDAARAGRRARRGARVRRERRRVEASREARPYALGLLGVVLATLLFVFALERGGGWRWIPYAVVAAALPLTHPLAASVLAAHGAALIALRERPDLRRAGIALARRDGGRGRAARLDGRRPLRRPRRRRHARSRPTRPRARPSDRLESRAPVAAASPASSSCSGCRGARSGRWRGVLVAALIAAPLVALLLAALALPVFTGALVLCAPGLALAAGAAAPLLSPARGLVWAGVALLLVSSAVTAAIRLTTPPRRGLARARGGREARPRRQRDGRRRAASARGPSFAYYAPYLPRDRPGRGDGRLGRGRRRHAGRCDRRGASRRAHPDATRCCASSATATACGCSTGCGREPSRGQSSPTRNELGGRRPGDVPTQAASRRPPG